AISWHRGRSAGHRLMRNDGDFSAPRRGSTAVGLPGFAGQALRPPQSARPASPHPRGELPAVALPPASRDLRRSAEILSILLQLVSTAGAGMMQSSLSDPWSPMQGADMRMQLVPFVFLIALLTQSGHAGQLDSGAPKPPVAKKVPKVSVHHGEKRVDAYF